MTGAHWPGNCPVAIVVATLRQIKRAALERPSMTFRARVRVSSSSVSAAIASSAAIIRSSAVSAVATDGGRPRSLLD